MLQTITINKNKTKNIIFTIKNKKKIKWDPKVIDNEHMKKKKSKCCCQHPLKCEYNCS